MNTEQLPTVLGRPGGEFRQRGMRAVVVERFSYRATLDRFLNEMASYLRQASEAGVAQLTA